MGTISTKAFLRCLYCSRIRSFGMVNGIGSCGMSLLGSISVV